MTPAAPRLPSLWRRVPNTPDDWFSAEELDRARRYRKPVSRARLLRMAVSTVALLVIVFAEMAPKLVDGLDITNWVLQLIVIVLFLELVSTVISTPFDAWLELRHDREWELSTQTERGFAADLAKGLVLGLIVNVVLLLPLVWVIRTTPTWWLWGWLVMVTFTIGLGFLYPVLIAPIFNTFTPLEDEDMNGRVDRIADIAGVQISGTYVADESKRSRRDNAYVAGLGATRRVVLFDTLLEHPPEVVEQVVAHEIGHWRLKHLRKQLPVIALLLLALFAGLKAFSEWTWIFEQAGVTTSGDVPYCRSAHGPAAAGPGGPDRLRPAGAAHRVRLAGLRASGRHRGPGPAGAAPDDARHATGPAHQEPGRSRARSDQAPPGQPSAGCRAHGPHVRVGGQQGRPGQPVTGAGSGARAALQVGEALGHDAPPDPPAPLLADDQPGLGEDLGVVADRRLRLARAVLQVAGAHLAGAGDQAEQAEPDRIGQRGEAGGERRSASASSRGAPSTDGQQPATARRRRSCAGWRSRLPLLDIVLTNVDTFAMSRCIDHRRIYQEDARCPESSSP